MDRTTDLREHVHATAPAESWTFMGSIRWVALAIGLACLALLSMIAGVAHAGSAADEGAASLARTSATATSGIARAAPAPSLPAWQVRTERRKPSDR